jgi:uncharacterized membrane protein
MAVSKKAYNGVFGNPEQSKMMMGVGYGTGYRGYTGGSVSVFVVVTVVVFVVSIVKGGNSYDEEGGARRRQKKVVYSPCTMMA